MAGPFSRLLSARPGLRLLALAGAGSLAAGFLLRREPSRAASERGRLYPPRYLCFGGGGGGRGENGDGDEDLGKRQRRAIITGALEWRCAVWKPQWCGGGGQNLKAKAFLGTWDPALPALKASSGLSSSGCTHSDQIPN